MPSRGRNARCPCGSGKKVKYCCGEARGPSDTEHLWAALAKAQRAALSLLAEFSHDELEALWLEMLELPHAERSLLVFPEVVTPEFDRFLQAIEDHDDVSFDASLPHVVAAVDKVTTRVRLAWATMQLLDAERIAPEIAAVALCDLADRRPSFLVASAVIHAAAVAIGDIPMPRRLEVAAAKAV